MPTQPSTTLKLRTTHVIDPTTQSALDAISELGPMRARQSDERKVVCIFIDTSGSMPNHVIKWLTKSVSDSNGLDVHWFTFTLGVKPFAPGDAVSSGGGTNFDDVMDYVEGRTEVNGLRMGSHPDVVVMLTDGYAAPIRPPEPGKWVWLITEGGSDGWIREQPDPMKTYALKAIEGLS